MSPALLFLIAAGGNDAHAWSHTGNVWPRRELPIIWAFADIEEDSMAWEDVSTAIDASWGIWTGEAAACADLTVERYDQNDGIRNGYRYGFRADDVPILSFEDPEDQLGIGGVLAATVCWPGGTAFDLEGKTYTYTTDCDIVYSSTVNWTTAEAIDNNQCSGEFSLQAVTTHEMGHLWGLGHSCDDPNDVDDRGRSNYDNYAGVAPSETKNCNNGNLRDAIMFWSVGPCDNGPSGGFTDDDITGLYALYGPFCSFSATEDSEVRGGVADGGLEVCFELSCNEEPSAVEFDFGDGNTLTEPNNDGVYCNTYTTDGQFSVNLNISGSGETCGSWEYTQRAPAAVLVCGEPAPAEGFDGLFTYEGFDGLLYQMVNQVDTSVYGCVEQIEWHVFEGTDTSGTPDQIVAAWSPKIEFPAEGTYTVVLNVGGPGGIKAHALEIDVVEVKGQGGCSTMPLGAGLAGLAVAAGAALRRRRR
ncbi:MAG: Matrixin [Pseudomonadota bacterium]|jgi:hypothetical protein